MVRRAIHLVILIFGFIVEVIGQDVHFTQHYMQPLYTNPAQTGDFIGEQRLSIVHRRQWGQLSVPIISNGFSYDQKIRVQNEILAGGIQLVNDQVKEIGLKTNQIFLSGAYLKRWLNSLWHIGIQAGYTNSRIDLSAQSFPAQYHSPSGTFDPNLSNPEPGLQQQSSYLDFNAGLLWVKKVKGRFYIKTGLSVAHINQPNHSFYQQDNQVPLRYIFHHNSQFFLSPIFQIMPQVQIMRMNNATDMTLLALFKRQINKQAAVIFGPGYRGYGVQSDAAIVVLGAELGYMTFGVSMDWNVSTLSQDVGRKSTLEISAILRTPPKKYITRKHGKRTPCIQLPEWE